MKALPRLLAAAVTAGGLMVAGCTTSVTGAPAPLPGSPAGPGQSASATPTTPAPTSPAAPTRGGCQVTVTSTGSIRSSGASSRIVTRNGHITFSCGSGPMIGIESIDGSGVTFSADGPVVTIAPGSTAAVGGYQISVASVEGGTAQFQVQPPD